MALVNRRQANAGGRCSRPHLLLLALAWVSLWPALAGADIGQSWSKYFPETQTLPADAAGWATLAQAFPNRVKSADPATTATPTAPAATRLEIRSGIEYVRVRQLANDLDTIAEALKTRRLIIDLRYVHAELDAALRFGALLARKPLELEGSIAITPAASAREAGQTTLCLVNRATSGALEAVLDALQAAGEVLLVGTQTAGDTGAFAPAANAPGWRVIAGDYRRAGGHSLLDVGVTPGLFIETVPAAEDAAYLAFDASQPITELLDVPVTKDRFDESTLIEHFRDRYPGNGRGRSATNGAKPPGTENEENPESDANTAAPASADSTTPEAQKREEPAAFDRSLQRAVSTLVADAIFRDQASP